MPALLTTLLCLAVSLHAAAPKAEEARRIAFALEIAAAEYEKAVGGTVVIKAEQEEAVGFLSQARKRFRKLADATGLDGFTRGPIEDALAGLEKDARSGRGDPAAFRARAARAGLELAAAFGASARPAPAERPSARAGAEVYRMHCAMCHGARGDGHGPARPGLEPKPASFADAEAMRRAAPADLFRVVTVGVDGTAMTAFDDRLSELQRWDAVQHIFSFTNPPETVARGRALLESARLSDELESEGARAESSALELERRLAAVLPKATAEERASMAAALRLEEPSAPRAPGRDAAERRAAALVAVAAELDRSVAMRAAGNAEDAAASALDAYLLFEPLESEARVDRPSEAAALERSFAGLQDALKAGAPLDQVERHAADIRLSLQGLAGERGPAGSWGAFAQSFLIIAREGFEAILVLGAIAALLTRAGRGALLGVFYAGAWTGVAASFATAWILGALLDVTPVQREALEGLVMLAAAVTLMYVSYWMLATIGMRQWNRWLRGRLGKALEGDNAWALGAVAFLAVYREGFETVLFYQALVSFAPGQGSSIAAGFIAGTLALAVVFAALRMSGLRLPMRPFFLATGTLLYAMAVVYIGRGVAELQAAGWVFATATPWALSVPSLGIRPTWQTSAPQLVLLAAGLAAAWSARGRGEKA